MLSVAAFIEGRNAKLSQVWFGAYWGSVVSYCRIDDKEFAARTFLDDALLFKINTIRLTDVFQV
jgi:hypothetical protein